MTGTAIVPSKARGAKPVEEDGVRGPVDTEGGVGRDALQVHVEERSSDQNPATYGSFPAVASIAVPASRSTAVESHVPATS